ncbi:phosphotransferase family protein [Nocardioides marmoraquaticus]
MSTPLPELLAVAAELLPGLDADRVSVSAGQDHEVLLFPGTAVVRVARHPSAAAALERRTALLRALDALDLPFAVPTPLSPVRQVGGRTAVALSWLPGEVRSRDEVSPEALGELLDALAGVDLSAVAAYLDVPHAYAGRERWHDLLLAEAVPRLPERLQDEARRRVDAAAALDPVAPRLVHGDLAGANVHWDERGRVCGVLDWEVASPFDPAVDAACLAHFGWEQVRAVVDPTTYDRARTWWRTFGIEQVVAAVLTGEPDAVVTQYVAATTRWLDATP